MALSQPIVCPILVGRSESTASLADLVRAVAAGRGEFVLVSGEAGIGKTRLVKELTAVCSAAGWPILAGNCFEPDRRLPYSAWLDLFRRSLAALPEEERDELLAGADGALRLLLPEQAALLPPSPPATGDALQERQQLFRAMLDLLRRLTNGRPAVLILEDLHWSDEASLDFLLHVGRRLGEAPLLIAATYRNDEVGDELGGLLSALDRERIATELSLDPLTAPEVEKMIGAIFATDRPLGAGFLADVYGLTEGNPFFIEEVLRVLRSDDIDVFHGFDPAEARQVPRSVREAVRRRSAAIDAEARHLAQLASVAGRHFDFGLLRQLTGHAEADLLVLVKELIAAQLVVEESVDRFGFRHALTREAIYSELLGRERQSLHQSIGEALAALHAEDLAAHAADLGYHFFEARDWPRAFEYGSLAGEQAERAWAQRAAVEHYTRALTASRELAVAAPAKLLRARGRCLEAIGDFDGALGDLEAARAATAAAGDQRGEWQTLLDLGLLWSSRDYGRAGQYCERALALARETGDASMLAPSLNRLGNWYSNVDRPQDGLALHKQALATFESLRDRAGIATTLDLLGMACYMSADMVQGIGYYERAIVLLRELDDRAALISALSARTLYARSNYQTDTLVPCGLSPMVALRGSEEAGRLAAQSGMRAAESFALWSRGTLLGQQGEYVRALDESQRGLRIAEEIGHEQWIAGSRWVLGMIYFDVVALDRAQEQIEAMQRLVDQIGSTHWRRHAVSASADICIARNDLAGAEALLRDAMPETMEVQANAQRLLLCSMADLALAQGDGAEALRIVDRLESITWNREVGPRGVRLSQLVGSALMLLGRLDEAESALLEGRDNAVIETSQGRLWRLEVALAHLYERRGDAGAAEAAIGRARAVIEKLQPALPPELRDGFVAGATATFPASMRTPRAAPRGRDASGLTARERDVVALVAAGHSNRAIADLLVLSERTVETHVSSVLAKLGFSSRAQVAAWAVENGLVVH